MLSDTVITTILQVSNGSVAVELYRDRLGLNPKAKTPRDK
jgi:hypothetical protein